jgi:hypothetical protein
VEEGEEEEEEENDTHHFSIDFCHRSNFTAYLPCEFWMGI